MPYGEESAYAAQAALKKKSPTYIKSSGFKMKMGNSPAKWNPFFVKSAKTERYDVEGGGEGVKKTRKHLFTGRTKTIETQKTDDAKRTETIVYNKDGSVKSTKRKKTNV